MRFKFGLMIGFATGYYFGTMAGRERYEQIQQWIHKLTTGEEGLGATTPAGDRVSGTGTVSTTSVSPRLPTDLPA